MTDDTKRAAWLAIRNTPRHRQGRMIWTSRGAGIFSRGGQGTRKVAHLHPAPADPLTRQQRHDSTRNKRAAADRAAKVTS